LGLISEKVGQPVKCIFKAMEPLVNKALVSDFQRARHGWAFPRTCPSPARTGGLLLHEQLLEIRAVAARDLDAVLSRQCLKPGSDPWFPSSDPIIMTSRPGTSVRVNTTGKP
jgi:hypothetical protein